MGGEREGEAVSTLFALLDYLPWIDRSATAPPAGISHSILVFDRQIFLPSAPLVVRLVNPFPQWKTYYCRSKSFVKIRSIIGGPAHDQASEKSNRS